MPIAIHSGEKFEFPGEFVAIHGRCRHFPRRVEDHLGTLDRLVDHSRQSYPGVIDCSNFSGFGLFGFGIESRVFRVVVADREPVDDGWLDCFYGEVAAEGSSGTNSILKTFFYIREGEGKMLCAVVLFADQSHSFDRLFAISL